MGSELQREAWQWALANRADDGSLPSGKQIADRYGRHERWGRLVKHAGSTGKLSHHERTADEQVSPQPHRQTRRPLPGRGFTPWGKPRYPVGSAPQLES
jgi:hypothetical protein